jgi:U3 small nucleolar ribonucleoprotein component
MEIITSLVGVVASMISYILVDYVWKFSSRFTKKSKPVSSYSEKLSQLTSNLIKSSKEVDRVLNELSNVATEREGSIKILENNLLSLEKKEIDLKQKIETLEKLPVPVAEHFAKLMESGEKRSARRDYLLFGAGVAVSTVIAIILKYSGIG